MELKMKLAALTGAGLFFRAIPHLFLIPRWIIEEQYNFITVSNLVKTGSTPQLGFYPILEHQIIYWVWMLTHIDPVTLSQYANPLFGALTVLPLYYVLRHTLDERSSLIGCLIWSLSEAAMYRAAYFGSTETLSFLFSLTVFALYQRRRILPAMLWLGAAVFTHLLPAVFVGGVIALDVFLNAKFINKIAVFGLLALLLLVFFSPLNPHQRILQSFTPEKILSGFNLSNLSLYSLKELFIGVEIFPGLLMLGVFGLYAMMEQKRNRLMSVYLLCAAGLFAFSWVNYMPNVFAPPRLTFYFLVPLIYYVAKTGSTGIMTVVCILSLVGASYGFQPMLYVQDSLTLSEFNFLDNMNTPVNSVRKWWTDYPMRTALTSFYNANPSIELDDATVEKLSKEYADPYSTMKNDTKFRYVLISPRMESRGLFFIYAGNRVSQVRKPVTDIWSVSDGWTLIKEIDGIKLYERVQP